MVSDKSLLVSTGVLIEEDSSPVTRHGLYVIEYKTRDDILDFMSEHSVPEICGIMGDIWDKNSCSADWLGM
ncbi:TPA: hypothetical protein GXX44_09675 [bacterium]|nr:hypothetical protein [bacterium]HPO82280.1 hypothetical protein [bacterium]